MHYPYSVPDQKLLQLVQREWPSMPLLGHVTAQGTHTGTDSHGSHPMIQGKLPSLIDHNPPNTIVESSNPEQLHWLHITASSLDPCRAD